MNTSTSVPSQPVLWLLDHDDDLLRLLCELVGNATRLCFKTVKPFNEPAEVRRSLVDEESKHQLPWFFVSDSIGFKPDATGEQSVAHILRKRSPLSIVFLHSLSAYQEVGMVSNLTRERLIDRDESKNIRGAEFLAIIEDWYRRWECPIATRMRQYIAQCPDPETPYFPDNDGHYLSVNDLYREMILQSEIGIEAEKVWEQILVDSGNHA